MKLTIASIAAVLAIGTTCYAQPASGTKQPEKPAAPAAAATAATAPLDIAKAVLAAHGGDKLKKLQSFLVKGSVDVSHENDALLHIDIRPDAEVSLFKPEEFLPAGLMVVQIINPGSVYEYMIIPLESDKLKIDKSFKTFSESPEILKISKNGKAIQEKFAHNYYDQIGLGIDFTARDLQDDLKAKGQPWELAKSFDHSACLGNMVFKSTLDMTAIKFNLTKNGTIVQDGNSKDLIFSFDYLIGFISQYFTLQTGDLIFTGTPAGVGQIAIGDVYKGYLGEQQLLTCEIK